MVIIHRTMCSPSLALQVPQLLAEKHQWIPWRAGTPDERGKFTKVPVAASTGRPVDAHNPAHWLDLTYAVQVVHSGKATGVGFVLDGAPITQGPDGEPLYLIGIDIDSKSGINSADLDGIKRALKRTYIEISPSRTGLRLFVLSKVPVKAGNRNGREMYTAKRFLTVTGYDSRGSLVEATQGVLELHKKWFPDSRPATSSKAKQRCGLKLEETPANVAWVVDMLKTLSADCDYERYRDIIWAVEDLGWLRGDTLQRAWSQSTPDRFSEDCLQSIKRSFDPDKGIHFGTLVHHARLAGYRRAPCKR
jgi:hypothetical protein